MNWEWIVQQGLVAGDPSYYSSGKATAEEYAHAVSTAYLNTTDANRREFVDQLWSTGFYEGNKEYWYEDRSGEAGSLEAAALKMGGDAGVGAGTGEEGAGARFSIAGGAELWKNTDTGESYIVYRIPGTDDDPMYLRYLVPSESDLQSFFGPDQNISYNREVTNSSVEWGQTMGLGNTDALANTSENPFAAWSETLATSAKTQPWLLDDDYQALFAQAILEQRELRPDEIALTKWYSEHNEGQRSWMTKFHMDPLSAQQELEANRISAAEYMRSNGLNDIDQELVNYMADKWTQGDWTEQELQWQSKVLTDPYFAAEPLDTDLQKYIDDNSLSYSQTLDEANEVRDMVERWLGTNFGQWSDEQVNDWAGRFRNETDAEEKLMETLKDQKSALFPEYDREADYATISAPWRTMMRNMWGEVPNDSDNVLHQVIRMNDVTEAGQYLTEQGLARDNTTVTNNIQGALSRSFGGSAI